MSSSASTPEPLDPHFQLKLPSFEGPLDLLLHLAQKHELDILELPVAFVTERYLEYIRLMERLDLDIASEYLVMAATLAFIKSRVLLPIDPDEVLDDEAAEDALDPRQELILRLLEYQKYKAAAEELGARGVQGRDVFLRGMEAPEAAGPAPLAGVGLFRLLDAFQAVLKRAKQDLAFEVTAEGISIQERMTQLAERLRARRRCTFEELFDDTSTLYDLVITFMAILEMAKRRLAALYQSGPVAPIHLEYRVLDEDAGEGPSASDAEAPAPVEDDAAAQAQRAARDAVAEADRREAEGAVDAALAAADAALDLAGGVAHDPRPASDAPDEPDAPAEPEPAT